MKGRVFYLEDDPLWIREIKEMFDKDYEFYYSRSVSGGISLMIELVEKNIAIDTAIIDISMISNDESDQEGFRFIDVLEKAKVLAGFKVIILTGNSENIRTAFREFDVIDVFLKSDWSQEKENFRNLVIQSVNRFS